MKHLKQIGFGFLFAAIAVGLVLSLTFSDTPAILAQDSSTLAAVRVDAGTMDPLADLWAGIPGLEVALALDSEAGNLPVVAGYTFPPVELVTLKAVYTDDEIFVLAVWPDDTMNTTRRDWTFDGTTWSQNKLNEDRLSFMFNITGNRQFDALGCAGACHAASTDMPAYMGFPPDSTDAVDMWHWKASRTAPAGWADDQWAGSYVAEEETGRANDARESGGYSDNKNEAGDAPAFVYPEGAVPGSPLLRDTAIPFDPTMTFPAGYTVPGYIISRPVGSRGDVGSFAVYMRDQNGKGWWYVVLSRALNTGNPEDAVFVPGGSYTFGVAIFNNAGDALHTVSDKLTLALGE